LRREVERAFADREYPEDDRIADSDPRYESLLVPRVVEPEP
jgi:hypothetical protein